jgi:hypothetical protein
MLGSLPWTNCLTPRPCRYNKVLTPDTCNWEISIIWCVGIIFEVFSEKLLLMAIKVLIEIGCSYNVVTLTWGMMTSCRKKGSRYTRCTSNTLEIANDLQLIYC